MDGCGTHHNKVENGLTYRAYKQNKNNVCGSQSLGV